MRRHKTKLVGVLNVTPDSCSDGGKFLERDKAIEHAKKLLADGSDIIDIGAESTRPDSRSISYEEESRRLDEIIQDVYKICSKQNIPLSLDSRNIETLSKFKNFYDVVNDVTGLNDERIIDFIQSEEKDAIFMRSLSIPVKRSDVISEDQDVIEYIQNWLDKKVEIFEKKNLKLEKLIFDPGVGFGLGVQKDLELIKRVKEIDTRGLQMMIGHSRKVFLSVFGEKDYAKRDPETHVLSSYLMNLGVDYLRVHDVESSFRIRELTKELYK